MIEPKTTRLPSVRLSQTELRRLEKAADLAQLKTSEFIRRAIEKEVKNMSRRHPELQAA